MTMTMTATHDSRSTAYATELAYRDALVSEINGALAAEERGGRVDAEWLSDRIDALNYGNRKLAILRDSSGN